MYGEDIHDYITKFVKNSSHFATKPPSCGTSFDEQTRLNVTLGKIHKGIDTVLKNNEMSIMWEKQGYIAFENGKKSRKEAFEKSIAM